MADLTGRDTAYIERDRQLQFSQFGALAVLKIYDKKGELLRTVKRNWNRYRKTTRDNVTYFRFRVSDPKVEMSDDMRAAGDEGTLEVLGERFRVTKLEGWKKGESKIWTVSTSAEDSPSSEFFQQP